MSKEFGRVKVIIRDESNEGTRELTLDLTEEEAGYIKNWSEILWTILTFMGFYPKTIEEFLTGKHYEQKLDDNKDDDIVVDIDDIFDDEDEYEDEYEDEEDEEEDGEKNKEGEKDDEEECDEDTDTDIKGGEGD